MKPTTIIAVVLIVVGTFSIWKPQSKQQPLVIELPSVTMQEAVAPITELLNGRSAQADVLSAFYLEVSKNIRRDGDNKQIVQTKSHLRTFCERATTIRFQGVFKGIPGLAEAIHGGSGALSKILGLEAGPLDHAKTADALQAVAWACQEAM